MSNLNRFRNPENEMITVSRSATLFLTIALSLSAMAQSATAPKPAADAASAKPSAPSQREQCDADISGPMHTFYLKNAVQASDANEIVTAIRNMANPCSKVYLVANQEAVTVRASAADLALIEQILSDLDRPKKTYRLTYTVSEVDGTKFVDTQHYTMVVVSGQQTQLKQGSKVPIATGSYNAVATTGEHAAPAGVQTQFTYVDIGMNFAVTLDDFANGVRLNTNVEQSSVAGQSTISGVVEPVIRVTSLKTAAFLTPGKPIMLGSVDIPGTARRLDIEVKMDQLP
jgi:type II secretory pathway component GspD/PulD (secretin)